MGPATTSWCIYIVLLTEEIQFYCCLILLGLKHVDDFNTAATTV
jgi:hypothetical protein